MDELFAFDAQAREQALSQEDRQLLRLEKSKPLLEQIKTADSGGALMCTAQECSGQGLQLHADALDTADPFPGISRVGVE